MSGPPTNDPCVEALEVYQEILNICRKEVNGGGEKDEEGAAPGLNPAKVTGDCQQQDGKLGTETAGRG